MITIIIIIIIIIISTDFQPFDLDAFLENLHQRRQQQPQEQE